jgi:hypothetical protein
MSWYVRSLYAMQVSSRTWCITSSTVVSKTGVELSMNQVEAVAGLEIAGASEPALSRTGPSGCH